MINVQRGGLHDPNQWYRSKQHLKTGKAGSLWFAVVGPWFAYSSHCSSCLVSQHVTYRDRFVGSFITIITVLFIHVFTDLFTFRKVAVVSDGLRMPGTLLTGCVLPQVDRVDERGTALCDISCLFGLRHEVSIVSNSTWHGRQSLRHGKFRTRGKPVKSNIWSTPRIPGLQKIKDVKHQRFS